jgi:hypothetical protein
MMDRCEAGFGHPIWVHPTHRPESMPQALWTKMERKSHHLVLSGLRITLNPYAKDH